MHIPQLTAGLRLAAFVLAVGAAMVILNTPTPAMLVVASGLLVISGVAHRSDVQRRRLQETLTRTQLDYAHLDQTVAAERDELTSQLQFWTTHDPLTRLANRTTFTRVVAEAVADAAPCGVMAVTLVDFGDVNATFGSAIGDQVLHAIAERLHHVLREDDVAGRLGADEFGILLRGLGLPDAQRTGERLMGVFNDPVVLANTSVSVRAVAGLAVTASGHDADALELLRQAELAAGASQAGSDVHLYAPALQAAAAERNRLEADLRRSLDAGEFVCHYQPIINAVDGRITAVEALVRWMHPSRGLVMPHRFIPAAERCGLIVPLGLHVLSQGCRQLSTWNRSNGAELTLAVNVSARQLIEPGFVEAVRAIVWGSGIDPRQIVLEITESLLTEDSDAAIATLWQLRGLGLRLAVDDFGTGYSSLSRLGDMPIDEVKVDKSFTDRINAATNDSAPIITATVAMGHALGLTVVAEGVETAAQANFLRSIDCDLLQGYLFARPLETDQTTPLLGHVLFDPDRPIPASDGETPPKPSVPRLLPAVTRATTKRLFTR